LARWQSDRAGLGGLVMNIPGGSMASGKAVLGGLVMKIPGGLMVNWQGWTWWPYH